MTATEATDVISSAVFSLIPDAEVIAIPMADGGEGSMEVLTRGRGIYVEVDSFDPLMRPLRTQYGLIGDTAVIDMAQEVGLLLLTEQERNPEKTSSYGFGVVIAEAVRRGAQRLLLGIGGSATNDCGIGMLAAMGVQFFDKNGANVALSGENLSEIEQIKTIDFKVPILVACDVTNRLYGRDGAAYVYAPQKGADEAMCERLDCGLRHFSEVVKRELKIDLSSIVGGGAAGGVGAALAGFLGAKMVNGTMFIAEELKLFDHIRNADLVITGEGRVDKSSLHDKLTHSISKFAANHGVPVFVVCGVAKDVTANDLGVERIIQLKTDSISAEESIARAKELLHDRIITLISDFV